MSAASLYKSIDANSYLRELADGHIVLDHFVGIKNDGTILLIVQELKTVKKGTKKSQVRGDFRGYNITDLTTAYSAVTATSITSGNLAGVKSTFDSGSKVVLTAAQLLGKQVLYLCNIDATAQVTLGQSPGTAGIVLDANTAGNTATARLLLYPCPQGDLFGTNSGAGGHLSTVSYALW